MKNARYLYVAGIFILAALTATIFAFKKQKDQIPALKERNGMLAASPEWMKTKSEAETLTSELKKTPDKADLQLKLASIFIEEARITGDYGYYNNAALKMVNRVLTRDPRNFMALVYKSMIYLSAHQFSEGKEIAEEARKINPYNAYVYGLLVDANQEMGNYEEAVKMCDKMQSIRPDLRSYSRVSYLREIYGDMKGSIAAMKMAIKAGMPGTEETSWTWVMLGRLYENTGARDTAEMCYTKCISERANYAPALAGMTRVEEAKKNYSKAIGYVNQAVKIVPDYSYYDLLTDLYRLSGQKEKADENAGIVVNMLLNTESTASGKDMLGHNASRELTYAYLKAGDLNNALQRAQDELKRRPLNNDVNEALAWVYYNQKRYAEASGYIRAAMRTHSANPMLLYRAGLIETANGNKTDGAALLQKAYSIDPFLLSDPIKDGQVPLSMK